MGTSITSGPPGGAARAHDIRLDGASLDRDRHVCALFTSEEEQYALLTPFIRDGLDAGERSVQILDPDRRDMHLARLSASGIDVAAALASGSLVVLTWPEAYGRHDRFDQDAMLELIREILDTGRESYPLTRLVANMEWALTDLPGVSDIVEYEARLNDVLVDYADPVICTYDLGRFSAGIVVDMLRTHPVAVVGGQLHQNPFYVTPAALREELRGRREVPPA